VEYLGHVFAQGDLPRIVSFLLWHATLLSKRCRNNEGNMEEQIDLRKGKAIWPLQSTTKARRLHPSSSRRATKELFCGLLDRMDLLDALERPLERLLGLTFRLRCQLNNSTPSLPEFPPTRVLCQPASVNAKHIAQEWTTQWESILTSTDVSALETVLRQDC
jgi:hypothetical protein